MKTLENYFDDWHHVGTDVLRHTLSDIDNEIHKWLIDNIGIRGLEWDLSLNVLKGIPIATPKRGAMMKTWDVFKFKRERDALMFILRWEGTIIQKNQ